MKPDRLEVEGVSCYGGCSQSLLIMKTQEKKCCTQCLPVRVSQNSKGIFHYSGKKEKQLLVICLTLLGLNLISRKHLELITPQFWSVQ